MMNTYTICYLSKAKENITNEEVEAVFKSTYTNNTLKQITGILLFMMGDFFQVLEGPKEKVIALYDNIKEDTRHTDVFEVINRTIEKPVFKDYKSHFNIVRNDAQIKEIKQYLRTSGINTTAEKIDRLLEPFFLLP